MKLVSTMFAAGCAVAAASAIVLAPVPAVANSCEALRSRLDQAQEMEQIHRKNSAIQRELFNEAYKEKKFIKWSLDACAKGEAAFFSATSNIRSPMSTGA
jgi:hypothetical protein